MLIEGAQITLRRRRSVSAQVRQEVELLGHRMLGSGAYLELQSTAGRMSRLELRIQVGEQTTSLVQVCDGRSIWTHRRLFDEGRLERVDLVRVREALRQAGRSGDEVPLADVGRLCGLSRLLDGLGRSFQFAPPQSGLWGPDELPVWRLAGRWAPARLAGVSPDREATPAEGQEIDPAELPPQMPDEVVLLLGQADLFPYRVEYRRTKGSRGRFLVTMDLYDAVFDVPIDPSRFAYASGDAGAIDGTPDVLRSLGLAEQ